MTEATTTGEVAADAAMTGAEFHVMREGLGYSRAELAARLGVTVQTIGHWERDRYPIPEGVHREVLAMADAQAEAIIPLIESLNDSPGVTLTIPRGGGEHPAGYWRAVAWQVEQHVTGLRIQYADA